MAQLTLSQRSALANNNRFQRRLKSALDKTANYWAGAPYDGGGAPRVLALEDYTLTFQKKKRAIRLVLGLTNIAPWASMFMAQYNEDADPNLLEDPNLAFDENTNQISDDAILNSSVLSAVYDGIGGIIPADNGAPIEW
jgi:hypothetical protein